MTIRQRIMASAGRGESDKLAFFHWWRHSQLGWAERQCRNVGMGICWARPCYTITMHGVEITEQYKQQGGTTLVHRTYSTPVGEVSMTEKLDPGTGHWHGRRSWRDSTPWATERFIRHPAHYAVMKYIAENTEYQPDYFPIEQAADWLGDDGLVVCDLMHSPMQTLMVNWVGSDAGRIFYHLADCPDLVEDLYHALCKSRRPLYDIAAESPAEIVMCGDNLDGFLVTPALFEKYFMPVYAEQSRTLHSRGKLMALHMDGRLNSLRSVIARTDIDIVEAVHPPPMGDLPIAEALKAWPHKSVWIGFPSSVYDQGPDATRTFAENLLTEIAPGRRTAIEISTENLVSNQNLLALTQILQNATLPLPG